MSDKYEYDYPRANITADCIVTHGVNLLLIKRKNDPYKGMWALPGGYFDPDSDESVEVTAIRELEEETTIKVSYMDFLKYYDKMDRDPRDRTITFVFHKALSSMHPRPVVEALDDAAEIKWFSFDSLWETNMAFDHKIILKDFLKVRIST